VWGDGNSYVSFLTGPHTKSKIDFWRAPISPYYCNCNANG